MSLLRSRHQRLGAAALMTAALATACANSPELPDRSAPAPERARAALATVEVDNRTAHALSILYRIASRPATVVGVGRVPPRSTAVMAPVPAAEPLIFVARLASGAELVLPPRTLDIDGSWTWHIPANARFVRSPGEPAP